jgi:ATP-binding cassette, subfamily B, multidrug efflux pump
MSLTGSDHKAADTTLVRRLYPFVRPYRYGVLLALLLTIVAAWLGPLRPYLTQIAVDDHIAIGDIPGLGRIVLIFAVVLFGEFLLLAASTYLTRYIGQGALYRLRVAVFDHIQHLHVQFFDKNPIGRLITRSTSDIEALSDLLSNGVVNILGDMLRIIFILGFMLHLSWELTLVSVAILPVLIYSTILFKNRVRVAFLRVRDQIARMNAFIQEHINGLIIVQLFGREKMKSGRFQEINADHAKAHIDTIYYFALFWPVVEVLSSIAMTLVLWYGGMRVVSEAVTFGVLLAFIQYVRQFFQPIRDLSDQVNTLQSALASSERIFSVLDTPSDIPEPVQPKTVPQALREIRFESVDFQYVPEEPVLHKVSFGITSGTMVAVVGATGAGKSTLTQLLLRFYDPQGGRITIDGTDIRDFNTKDLRRCFGLVLQDNALFSGSVMENITLGDARIQRDDVIRAARRIQADSFINRLPGGYDHKLQERGRSLSMGQRQLLCFLRVMVHDPQVVVLDEATSSIDSESEELVAKALNTMMAGRTAIVIAHRLSTIRHADVILVMHRGEVRESGRHAELLLREDGLYRRLYELQYKDQVA